MLKKLFIFIISFISALFILGPRSAVQAAVITLDYNDIAVDGSVSFGDPTYTRWVVGNFHQLGDEMGTDKHRAYLDFNTTDIPDGATINSVTLNINVQYAFYSGEFADIKQMDNPSTYWANDATGNSTFWAYMGSETTLYADNYDGFSSTGAKTISLGSTAATDLQNQLASDWFSISLLSTDENSYDSCQIRSMAAVAEADRPSLTIDYTLDETAPAITLDAITPDPTTDTTPVLTGTATDADTTVSSVEFQINGTLPAGWLDCTADDGAFDEASEDFTCTLGTLGNGSYVVYVQSTDASSNVTAGGSESSDSFTVDTSGGSSRGLVDTGQGVVGWVIGGLPIMALGGMNWMVNKDRKKKV